MQIVAERRTKLGKKTQSIRKERGLPAVVFGKGMESIPVTVGLSDFLKVYKEAGETSLVDLVLDGEKEKILIKEIQVDPVTSAPLHVNFHKVNLKEKITADVPVEVIGEEENELIKSKEAITLLLLDEIAVEALPSDLPHVFEVDVSGLKQVGDGITVAQLKYDRDKVELVDNEDDELVVKLDYAVQAETEAEEEAVLSEEEMLEKLEATEEGAKSEDAETEEDTNSGNE